MRMKCLPTPQSNLFYEVTLYVKYHRFKMIVYISSAIALNCQGYYYVHHKDFRPQVENVIRHYFKRVWY